MNKSSIIMVVLVIMFITLLIVVGYSIRQDNISRDRFYVVKEANLTSINKFNNFWGGYYILDFNDGTQVRMTSIPNVITIGSSYQIQCNDFRNTCILVGAH